MLLCVSSKATTNETRRWLPKAKTLLQHNKKIEHVLSRGMTTRSECENGFAQQQRWPIDQSQQQEERLELYNGFFGMRSGDCGGGEVLFKATSRSDRYSIGIVELNWEHYQGLLLARSSTIDQQRWHPQLIKIDCNCCGWIVAGTRWSWLKCFRKL